MIPWEMCQFSGTAVTGLIGMIWDRIVLSVRVFVYGERDVTASGYPLMLVFLY